MSCINNLHTDFVWYQRSIVFVLMNVIDNLADHLEKNDRRSVKYI